MRRSESRSEIDYIIRGLIKPHGGLSMLVEPSLDELLTKVDNKFELVTLALKRARQINDGGTSIEHYNAAKPVSMALQEISKGEVYVDETGSTEQAATEISSDEDKIVNEDNLTASLSGLGSSAGILSSSGVEEPINIDSLSSGAVSLQDFIASDDSEEDANTSSIADLAEAVNSDESTKNDPAVFAE
ncbi:MAG: DNA-directed RNA polymerase subunit omega [Candidatus Bruticola sp.]